MTFRCYETALTFFFYLLIHQNFGRLDSELTSASLERRGFTIESGPVLSDPACGKRVGWKQLTGHHRHADWSEREYSKNAGLGRWDPFWLHHLDEYHHLQVMYIPCCTISRTGVVHAISQNSPLPVLTYHLVGRHLRSDTSRRYDSNCSEVQQASIFVRYYAHCLKHYLVISKSQDISKTGTFERPPFCLRVFTLGASGHVVRL